MSKLVNKDSPAFPMDFQLDSFKGLTKREWVAAQILNSLLINPKYKDELIEDLVGKSLRHADVFFSLEVKSTGKHEVVLPVTTTKEEKNKALDDLAKETENLLDLCTEFENEENKDGTEKS